MRTTWKRTAVGLMIAGAVGGAAFGLANPNDPPTFIPHADDPTAVPGVPELPAVADDTDEVVVPVQSPEPVLKNDPAVAMEWSGPAVVKANSPTDYTLTVRNACGQNLQKVVVQVRAPKGVEIVGVAPAVKPVDGVFLWDLGTLPAKDSKAMTVTLRRPVRGEMTCQAWVTFTGTAAMSASVKEPKLSVSLKAPDTVILGDKFPVEYAVRNAGDYPADEVVLTLTPGTPAGEMSAVVLKPGQSHAAAAEFVATSGGVMTYEAVATGADGLKATTKATVNVLVPKLEVKVSGPAERLIGKKVPYTVTVTNSGEVPVHGVTVSETLPDGFKVSSTGDGTRTDDTLTWSAGDLPPGAGRVFEFEGVTHKPGPLTHKVRAAGDRNTTAAGECVTTVEGIPGLRMELVDSADPVEKNGEVTYQIKVTNTGTKADADVAIECELPPEFEFVSGSGPTKGQLRVAAGISAKEGLTTSRTVRFEPISVLAPKTEAVFKVKVKGVSTGDVRFKAVMTSKHLTAPVTNEESTRVYGE